LCPLPLSHVLHLALPLAFVSRSHVLTFSLSEFG
jgi:hypothetical protein